MSGPERGFLARWSRRKAESQQAPPPEGLTEEAPPELPPLDSLGRDSDYTVFLARGVSQAIQAQALRVAWASDPAIAEFRGMAEYAWDFNAPGYGDLASGDDAAVWLSQVVRSGASFMAAEPAALEVAPSASPDALSEQAAAVLPADAKLPETVSASVPPEPARRRRHGGAVPA